MFAIGSLDRHKDIRYKIKVRRQNIIHRDSDIQYIYGSTRIFGEISVADFFDPGWNFFLKLGRKLPYRTLNNGTENYINPFI